MVVEEGLNQLPYQVDWVLFDGGGTSRYLWVPPVISGYLWVPLGTSGYL